MKEVSGRWRAGTKAEVRFEVTFPGLPLNRHGVSGSFLRVLQRFIVSRQATHVLHVFYRCGADSVRAGVP